MKNKLLSLILIISLIMLPSKVKADDVNISITCPSVNVGQQVTCTVRGTSSSRINAIDGNISISGGASIVSVSKGNDFNAQMELSSSRFGLLADNSKSSFELLKIIIKGNQAGSATLRISGINASDEDFNTLSGTGTSKTISITPPPQVTTTAKPSTTRVQTTIIKTTTVSTTTQKIWNLKPTSIKVGEFNVTEESGNYYATVNYDTEVVEVSATAEEGIQIIGTGKRNLAVGKNLVELVMISPDGGQLTVQVIITRPEDTNNYDTSLASLKVVDYELDFKPDVLEYNITVPSNVKEIYLIAKSNNKDVIIQGDGLQTLTKGENKFYIKVLYGDKFKTEYIVNVNRSYKETILFVIIGVLTTILIGYIIFSVIKFKNIKEVNIEVKNKEIASLNREQAKQKESIRLDNGVSIGLNGALAEQNVSVVGEGNVPSQTENVLAATIKPQIVTPMKVTNSTPPQTNVGGYNVTPAQAPEVIAQTGAPQVKVVKKVITPVVTQTVAPNTETVTTGVQNNN